MRASPTPKPTNPFARFLDTPEPADLGPGPRAGVRPKDELHRELDPLLANTILGQEHQHLIRALILLWHDHLDFAHRLAQDVPGPDGAFVHGIIHRREPDYSNAGYWFRRVGTHPALGTLARAATAFAKGQEARTLVSALVRANDWDPQAFINACAQAQANANPAQQELLRHIQRIESQVLLDFFVSGQAVTA